MRAGPELIDWKPKEIAWIETTNELIGIMAPWDAKLVVVGDNEDELNEAVRRLHRVGYKTQCLKFESWTTTKLDVAKNDMIEPQALYAEMQITEFPIIVDVRLPAEDAWLVRD